MPLQIVKSTQCPVRVDAVVTVVGGMPCHALVQRLTEDSRGQGGLMPGSAAIIKNDGSRNKYLIQTRAPVQGDGLHGAPEQIASCYRAALTLADEKQCETVVLPFVPAGERTLRIAIDAISAFLTDSDMTVYLAIDNSQSFGIDGKLLNDIRSAVDTARRTWGASASWMRSAQTEERMTRAVEPHAPPIKPMSAPKPMPPAEMLLNVQYRRIENDDELPDAEPFIGSDIDRLRDMLGQIDESFAQMLFRKIDERGMTDVECYKKANIDRKLFSKIKGNRGYRPSKPTALAFAVSLRLSLEETRELLMKAGFALSRSSEFDIIVEYCISHEIWDIHEINAALFKFDQSLLGGY